MRWQHGPNGNLTWIRLISSLQQLIRWKRGARPTNSHFATMIALARFVLQTWAEVTLAVFLAVVLALWPVFSMPTVFNTIESETQYLVLLNFIVRYD